MGTQLLIILLITGIGQFSLDLYLTSLPYLARYFHTSQSITQYSLGVFLIAMACSQMIYGPLSDQHGRKKILVFGLSILTIGTFICLTAKTIWIFILGRLIQGLGVGATSSLCKTIARDLYRDEALKRVMSLMIALWAGSLISAPLVGSVIQYYLGWHYIFLTLLFVILMVFAFILIFFKESNSNPVKKKKLLKLREMKVLYANKNFVNYCLMAMLCACVIYAYNLEAPFIIQIKLKLSPIVYGLATFLITAGYVVGSLINKRLLAKYQEEVIFKLTLYASILTSTAMVFVTLLTHLDLMILLISFFILTLSVGIIIPNTMANALNSVEKRIGLAAANYGLIIFGGGFVCNVIISNIVQQNETFYFILILSIFSFILLLNQKMLKLTSEPAEITQNEVVD